MKPLTVGQIADFIESAGYGKLPSGCHFVNLDREANEVVVIAPASPMPKIYYLKGETGDIVAFKAM